MGYMGHLHGKQRRMATGNGYQILPLPPVTAPPDTATAPPDAMIDPAGLIHLFNQEIFGIPVKWLALGVAAYFFMRK